jgi:hypothetical protein
VPLLSFPFLPSPPPGNATGKYQGNRQRQQRCCWADARLFPPKARPAHPLLPSLDRTPSCPSSSLSRRLPQRRESSLGPRPRTSRRLTRRPPNPSCHPASPTTIPLSRSPPPTPSPLPSRSPQPTYARALSRPRAYRRASRPAGATSRAPTRPPPLPVRPLTHGCPSARTAAPLTAPAPLLRTSPEPSPRSAPPTALQS